MSELDLKGNTALVTGAGTGIGRAIAIELGRHGADVILHYSHKDQLDSVRTASQIINNCGRRFSYRQADFTNDEELRFLINVACDGVDVPNIVVNNAGITLNKPIENLTAQQCDTLFAVNVRAPLLMASRLACLQKKWGHRRGSIINLASVHAHASVAGHSIYAATKGAIVAMTRQLAIELAPRQIRVNAIAPGWIETDYQHQIMEFTADEIGPKIPAGRIGQPEDVARLAVWLASDQSSYITGQTITIDGGMTSWLPVNEDWKSVSDAPFGRGYVPGI